MANPWEKYQPAKQDKTSATDAPTQEMKPWEKHAATVEEVPAPYDPTEGTKDLKGQDLINFYNSGKDVSARGRQGLGEVAESAGRLADYGGGLVRTGLAGVGGLVTANPNVVTQRDLINAATGHAPKSSEYLGRLGVPEGPSIELPYFGKTSARDVGGFLTDVVTDPTTAAAKVGKFNPVGEAVESVGKKTYKSGLKKVDERLAEKGAKPISDVLLEAGKTGTTKKLAKDAEAIGKEALAKRQEIYDVVKQSGQKIDVGGIAKRTKEKIAKMAEDPGLRSTAQRLQDMLDQYAAEGFVDIDKASDWKSNLYNALPESAYDAHGKLKGPVAQFQKTFANDFKNAIIEAGEKASPGLGKQIDTLNETMQSTISAKKPLAMQVRRAETPNYVTSVDAMLAAASGAASQDPLTTAGILAAKKSADLAKTTWARTKAGKGLMRTGRSGIPQGLLNRSLINTGLVDENE